jgi:23S rRNA (cytidine1920-2'-O)/16S rRNA (cytidine1409-2'-O)-methyltransferase
LISSGKISVKGRIAEKASQEVHDGDLVHVLETQKYVSRAGYKLEGAIREFNLNLKDKTILDIGSSTGGFTDCVLQHGARRVIAVDVGTEQFDAELKKDPRVELHEQTDIRNFLPKNKVGFIVVDVSFISLEHIIPYFKKLLIDGGEVVLLVKPQFEVGRELVGKGGVVRDGVRIQALQKIQQKLTENGFILKGSMDSPIHGGSGNKEFLIYAIAS